jgi:hypothetical protein
MISMNMVWTDEDERVYVVAPVDTSSLAVKRRMLKHCREFCQGGDTVTLEGEPKLSYLREPEGDEDEERLFDVEPDDPRANPVWMAGYWVSFAPRDKVPS